MLRYTVKDVAPASTVSNIYDQIRSTASTNNAASYIHIHGP